MYVPIVLDKYLKVKYARITYCIMKSCQITSDPRKCVGILKSNYLHILCIHTPFVS